MEPRRSWPGVTKGLGAALLLVSLVGAASRPDAPGQPSTRDAPCAAPPPLASWSVRALANQVVTVPIDAAHAAALAPLVKAGFGGILLFGAEAPLTLGQTIARLRKLAPSVPPFVMTDEEGGGVMRLTNLVSPFPWARTMADTMSPAQITAVAKRVGRQLLASGVSVDLAPVLDVDGRRVLPGATDPDGLRSFGGTESVVAADGAAFSAGLIAAGTIPVVKHFPGLGGSSGNSDNGPSATLPWPTLKATALHPFEVAIANGAPAVMVANAHVPGLTPLPASLSPRVLRGVLRQMLGFKGLIVTDSLTAGAISAAHLSPEAASAAAIENGADLVLLGAQTSVAKDIVLADRTSNAVVLAVQHGSLARATLQDAVAHILNAKALLHC